jgi:hypothetical protein
MNTVIDQAWLNANGPAGGPWLLNESGTFLLGTDVEALDTAFIIAAANVTLDGAGHEISYNTRPFPALINGDFSQELAGWDVSEAPGVVAEPPWRGMPGGGELYWPALASQAVLVSSPWTPPVIGHDYVATITPKCGANLTGVTLEVLDTVTGQTIAQKAASAPQGYAADRGFALVLPFTPTSLNPLQLRITLIPLAGQQAQVHLGFAQILPANDWGIIASPGGWAFPTQLKAAYGHLVAKAAGFTLRNCRLVQAGQGYSAHPVQGGVLPGLTVDQCEIAAAGMDASNIYAAYCVGPSVITNCKLTSTIPWLSDRMLDFGAINFPNLRGSLTVDGCLIQDYPQCGVSAYGQSQGTVTITNNTIKHNALVSDPYGITLFGVLSPEIAYNAILPKNGRGILIDGEGAPTPNADIHHNFIIAQEKPNLEYPPNALEATALRLRNFPKVGGGQTGAHIHDNYFAAVTGTGQVWCALACRVSGYNQVNQEAQANNLIERNTFSAYVSSTDPAQRAVAFSLSGVDAGTGLTVHENVFTSNDVGLAIGDNDSWGAGESDVTIDTCCWLSRPDPNRPQIPIQPHFVGAPGPISNIRVINPLSDIPLPSTLAGQGVLVS